MDTCTDRESRDLRLTLAHAFISTPTSLFLAASCTRLLPMASPARPEFLLTAVVALFVALILFRAALAAWLALATRLTFLPSALRLLFGRAVMLIGSGAARRLVIAGARSSALGIATLGFGMGGAAIAAPLPLETDSTASNSESVSWLWHSTDPTEASPSDLGRLTPSPQNDAEQAQAPTQDLQTPAHSPEQFPKTDQTRPQDLTHSTRRSEPSSTTDPDPRSTKLQSAPPAPDLKASTGSAPSGEGPLSHQGSELDSLQARATLTVEPGDCLWSIAETLLPSGASDSQIDAAWRALYAANASVVGSDPSLIHPGTVLVLPQELK